MTKILVLDADEQIRTDVVDALAARSWDVRGFADSDEAMGAASDWDPNVVVAGCAEADLAATFAWIETLKEKVTPSASAVLLTSVDQSGWDRTFASEDAFRVDALLERPPSVEALVKRIDGIIEARKRAEELKVDPQFDDILNRAIANEEAAATFYEQMAAGVVNPVTQDLLNQLAGEEQEHKQAILDFKAGSRQLPRGHVEAGAVLEHFGTPEFSPEMTPHDAFLLAAQKERHAVRFYEEWASLYPAGPEKELLEGLAEIERRHKAHVEEMFTTAAFPETWD